MMPLEKQVTSLAPSRRLKELGVKPGIGGSAFYWLNLETGWTVLYHDHAAAYDPINPISAFTVAELLPYFDEHEIKRERMVLASDQVRWMRMDWDRLDHRFWQDTTDANALAGLLIHLIEQGLVKP